ncbi:unnamed protein product [Ceutorhynchus assimilis]|uniref:C2 domain-containing protein n=1 Tax=Ceutorhynchus assimilis TaxID=467358 RepID=A0A9N9QI50_9CUCU|nr:unnamed protein product [Ceutorhynchus assimilis]
MNSLQLCCDGNYFNVMVDDETYLELINDPNKLSSYAEQVRDIMTSNESNINLPGPSTSTSDLTSDENFSELIRGPSTSTGTTNTENVFKWTQSLTLMLIDLRLKKEKDFNRPICEKKKLWEQIASEIKTKTGKFVTSEMCDIKYLNETDATESETEEKGLNRGPQPLVENLKNNRERNKKRKRSIDIGEYLFQKQIEDKEKRCLSPLFIPPSRGPTPDSALSAPPASPLGAIQPDLYLKKDGPLFIGCDARKSGGASLGRLHFRLSYDFDRSDFIVHLIEAHDLAGSDQGGFNDPYVRVFLIPEIDTRKRQTTIHRNEINPVFNEIFKFPVSHEELKSKSLLLQVFDYDRFSRNDIIGEVSMALTDYDCTNSIEIWGEITKNKKPPEEVQELLISLMYLPSAERLTLSLVKGRNLFIPQEKEFIDPFIKVYLIINGKRTKKKKSSCKKGNCNPVWNEALMFNLPSSSTQNTELEICVFDQGNDIMGSNPLLGCCTIGPKASGTGKEHWNDMIQSPRKTVFCWHTIRTVAETDQSK